MNKNELIQYIRHHYASLYVRGFGIFLTFIALIAGAYVLKNQIVIPQETYNFIIMVCFAWISFDLWYRTIGNQIEEDENKKLRSIQSK